MTNSSLELHLKQLDSPPRPVEMRQPLPQFGELQLVPYRKELPHKVELFEVTSFNATPDEAGMRQLLERTLDLQTVRDRLLGCRFIDIGISTRGDVSIGEKLTYLVVLYDYTGNKTIEIRLNEHGAFLGMSDEDYQPTPTQGEIEVAIELARTDARLANKLDGLRAGAIPYSGANNEFAHRRVIEVFFGYSTERLPKYHALVDVGVHSVLSAGEIC